MDFFFALIARFKFANSLVLVLHPFRGLELDLEMDTFLHARSTDLNTRSIRDTSPLEVWVHTTITTGVKLGSTNRVGIFSNNF